VHVSTLAEEAVKAFGGASGLAQKFFLDYTAADPGSNARIAIERLLVKLIELDTNLGNSKSDEDMDDDDLDSELGELVERVSNATDDEPEDTPEVEDAP
jgi:hypothetical protein